MEREENFIRTAKEIVNNFSDSDSFYLKMAIARKLYDAYQTGLHDRFPSLELLFRQVLLAAGEDPQRPALKTTPYQMEKAWRNWLSGYTAKQPLPAVFDFSKDSSTTEFINTVPFFSFCECHAAPIYGTIKIKYHPHKKFIISAQIVPVVEYFSRRLQTQTNLTRQIADFLFTCPLHPVKITVKTRAKRWCVESKTKGWHEAPYHENTVTISRDSEGKSEKYGSTDQGIRDKEKGNY